MQMQRGIGDSDRNVDGRSLRASYEGIGTRSVNGYWQADLGFHVACPAINLDRCTLGFAKIRLSASGRKEKKGRGTAKRENVIESSFLMGS